MSESFISPDYSSSAGSSFQFLGAKFQSSPGAFNANVAGAFSPQQSVLSYANVKELYYSTGGLQLGRKKFDWSLLDDHWHLGFVQPQFRWDPLVPESQGLTGIFWTIGNDDQTHPMGLRLFVSDLYLPDQGASYQLQNGSFQSVNPWFQQMPTQIQFDASGKVVNHLNWDVQIPDTSKVVLRPSAMAQYFYGHEHKDLYAAASVGYKPSNQLLMAVNSGTLPTPQTDVTIVPEVYNHTVGAIDIRQSFQSWYLGMSALVENPASPESLPSNLNYRVYNSRQMYSPTVGIKTSGLEISVSYLDIEGQSDFVSGPQSQVLAPYLPQQIGFGSAVQLEASYVFGRRFLPGLKLSSTYLQGAQDDFALWNSSARYKISRQWSVDGSVLLVRAAASSATASLFQQFQNNDMTTMGVNYAF